MVLSPADTVPPRVSLALQIDTAQVAQQVINGQLQTFVVWASRDPCPGYMVRTCAVSARRFRASHLLLLAGFRYTIPTFVFLRA